MGRMTTDLLDRAPFIAACTRLLELDAGPRVLSVEAGYGEGKTVFAGLWRDALADGPHVPVPFNAWRSDHADDPLAVFLAALAEAVPLPEGQAGKDKAKKVLGAFRKIGVAGARAAATVVVGKAVDQATDGVLDLIRTAQDDEGKDHAAHLQAFLDGADKNIDKALTGAIMDQLTAMTFRRTALPNVLDTIHAALIGPGGEEGKVVVLIDELDRCRPDFAVGLLEAVKHLFEDHPGFRFALMLNPARLEATAGSMYGVVEGGERYLTKFIDQRLRLPVSDAGRRRFMAARAEGLGSYTPWAEGLTVLGSRDTLDLPAFAAEHGFSLREIGQAFDTARLTFALYPGEPVEPTFLLALALCQHRELEGPKLLKDDRTGFERKYKPYAAVTASYKTLDAFRANYEFYSEYNEWKNDPNKIEESAEENSNLKLLRDECFSYEDYYELIFGNINISFDRINIVVSNSLRSKLLKRPLYKNPQGRIEEESLFNNAIRSFVLHHIGLLEKTAAFAIPSDAAP